ncbi:MAG: phenylalanine--tRNA ligase subunit alpha [Thaumarchaeota archaeon]|nr:phenylalanine--tRNA ligase subunit alpha [Nitrososphaerota archaeon]
MSQVFHEIEKKIIPILQKYSPLTIPEIKEKTGLESDQVRRGVEWLKLKNLAIVVEFKDIIWTFGLRGDEALEKGLPERILVNEIKKGNTSFEKLRETLNFDFDAAIAYAKKNNWINFFKKENLTTISLTDNTEESLEEKYLKKCKELTDGEQIKTIDTKELAIPFESLKNRDFIVDDTSITIQKISITDEGKKIKLSEIVTPSGAIDVEAAVPEVFVAKTHPLQDTINEIREIFVTLGFSEILGNQSQPCFWNFDALFTPQDHPARELQDTFYLDGIISKKIATSKQIQQVSKMHKNGWRYLWSIDEARKMVLRTHTTCVTIKYLADNKSDEARVFSLGRVFRNEKVSYKHLAEFNQVEGIVMGKNTTLRDLMGIQREFYRRMGLDKVKFWPTFFPYTEPSLQSMVYNERLDKWIELFGMGIFRPEVTKPLGITKPVLAWGGGIERIAMLKYGLDDVREFYNNNLKWLRSVTKCQ